MVQNENQETIYKIDEIKRQITETDKMSYLLVENDNNIIETLSKPLQTFLGKTTFIGKDAKDFYRYLTKFFPKKYTERVRDYFATIDKLEEDDFSTILICLAKTDNTGLFRYYRVLVQTQFTKVESRDTSLRKARVVWWELTEINKNDYDHIEEEYDLLYPTLEMIADKVVSNTHQAFLEFEKTLSQELAGLEKSNLAKLVELETSLIKWRDIVQNKIKEILNIDTPSATVSLQVWQPTTRDADDNKIYKPYAYLRAKWREGENTRSRNIRSFSSSEYEQLQKELWKHRLKQRENTRV